MPRLAPLVLALLVPFAAPALELPVEVGVGPAAYVANGAVGADQRFHWGLKLSVAAILDRETLRRFDKRIPPRYRRLLANTTEVSVSPSIFIPDSLLLSPALERTGLWGATWKPLALRSDLVGEPGDTFRLALDAGLLVTLALLHSSVLPTTFFARPGLDLGLTAELAFSESFALKAGVASAFYVPQALGGFGVSGEQTLCQVTQLWVKVCVRFPYDVAM